MASEFVSEVGDAGFKKEVLEADRPVLVDFWASWCGPCKAIGPMIDELAKSYQGKLKVVKFNVENDQSVPQSYGITSIPTLLFFKGGQVAQVLVGAPAKAKLVEAIEKVL